MSFLSLIFLYLKKKLNPGIPGFPGMASPVIPGYGKASEILNPSRDVLGFLMQWIRTNKFI